MAKKSMIARNNKRKKICDKFKQKRDKLLEERISACKLGDIEAVLKLNTKLDNLPKDSAPSRQNSRCSHCGRPRAVSKRFGLCRICTRLFFVMAYLPGVRKSSW